MESRFSTELSKNIADAPCTEIIESDGRPPIQGEDAVEFRLLYQGMLYSNGSVADKFLIRRQLHPQLRRLWSEHPLLRNECERIGAPHLLPTAEEAFQCGIKTIANTRINGFTFLPLARKGLFLRCSLDVLFLRREKPGRVFMNGDIDNRLKTLFDALQMPHNGQEMGSEVPAKTRSRFTFCWKRTK